MRQNQRSPFPQYPVFHYPQWLLICIAAAGAGALCPVAARAADPAEGSTQLQEVIVTAQKRSEDVQKVPMGITAISGETLQQQGAHDLNEVLTEVPNLSYEYGTSVEPGSGGQGMSASRGIAIRGISGAHTTSFYIDDTPVSISVDPRILDIDNVEVLKGPQGTLYGEASMGGTVKVVTRQPTMDAVSGAVDADVHDVNAAGAGTYDSFTTNVPLSTDAAIRFGAFYSYDPGFITRTYDDPSAINGNFVKGPAQTADHVGTATSRGGIATLLLQPSGIPNLTIEPMFIFERTVSAGFLASDDSSNNLVQRRALNVPEGWSDTFYLPSLTIRYDSPAGKIVSATSYFYRDSFDSEDGSDVTQQLFDLAYVTPVSSNSDLYTEQFTQEFRLESDIGSSLQTIAGIYFNDKLVLYDQSVLAPGANAASGGTLGTDVGYVASWPTKEYETALFASGTYSVTQQLKVTAGLRESFLDTRQAFYATGFYNGGTSWSNLGFKANALTPRFSAQYQATEENMVYATVAEGFRPGGAQTVPDICAGDLAAIGVSTLTSKYNNDSLWNYEVGSKNRWFDGRLIANVSIYDMEWKDVQQVLRLPVCGFDWVVNGAKARSQGAELELAVAPTSGLTLGASGGYEDARITGVASTASSGSLYVGQPLNGVPKWTGTAYLNYEYPTDSMGRLFFRAEVDHVGSSLSLNNSPLIGQVRPAYTLVDARLGTTLNSWKFALYAKNIGNEHPNLGDEISELVQTFGRPRYVVGPPRTIGIEVRKSF
jgi:iron complex outermembrane receptor protein